MTFARKWHESILFLGGTVCFAPRRQLSRNNTENWLLEKCLPVNLLTPLEIQTTRKMLAMRSDDNVMLQLEWWNAL